MDVPWHQHHGSTVNIEIRQQDSWCSRSPSCSLQQPARGSLVPFSHGRLPFPAESSVPPSASSLLRVLAFLPIVLAKTIATEVIVRLSNRQLRARSIQDARRVNLTAKRKTRESFFLLRDKAPRDDEGG